LRQTEHINQDHGGNSKSAKVMESA